MWARALLVHVLVCAVLARAAEESSPPAGAKDADVALAADDECEGDGTGSCSLNALQMQGHRRKEPPQAPQQPPAEADRTAAPQSPQELPDEAVSDPTVVPSEIPRLEGKVSRPPRNITKPNKTSPGGPCAEEYGCGLYDKARRCQCNANCTAHGNCCSDYLSTCAIHPTGPDHAGQVVTGYHQTSPEIGKLILGSAFRPGTRGYCGGAIYFAQTPGATFTKAVGPDSKRGFIIEATIDMGRSTYIPYPTCFSPWYCLIVPSSLSNQPVSSYLARYQLDSVTFNPGDGLEYVIGDPSRILSMKQWGT